MAANRKFFVNLAVEDLGRSVAFFTRLGFSFDPRFTDDSGTCMLVGEDAYVMLLTRARFAGFTTKELCDSTRAAEALFCVSADSREAVDEMVSSALSAGGSAAGEAQDQGFMYGQSFQDPDGHVWEVIWMDPQFLAEGPAVAAAAG